MSSLPLFPLGLISFGRRELSHHRPKAVWAPTETISVPLPKLISVLAYSWMSVDCGIPEVENNGFDYTGRQRWEATQAQWAWDQFLQCWNPNPNLQAAVHPNLHQQIFSRAIHNYFHGFDNQECGTVAGPCQTEECNKYGHPAGYVKHRTFVTGALDTYAARFLIMNSLAVLRQTAVTIHDAIDSAAQKMNLLLTKDMVSTFSPVSLIPLLAALDLATYILTRSSTLSQIVSCGCKSP